MKKASKILTLILVVVLLTSVLTGCVMFGRNSEKYRAQTIVNVGTQSITVGELLDAFNTQYNNYYYYISQGYFTAEQVFEIAASSLYEQAIKVDAYVSKDGVEKTSNTTYKNGEYLTAEELNFVVSYVKYLVFTNFDKQVETYLEADFDFNEVVAEDTSRDFVEYDQIDATKTYAEHLYSQNFVNEEMSEYFADYYAINDNTTLAGDTKLDKYVFADETASAKMLASYNDRLDDEDEKVTHAELVAAQNKVVALYKTNIKDTYGYDMDTFVKVQIESMIKSIIVAKYNKTLYKEIEVSKKADTVAALTKQIQALAANQAADFTLNDSFDSFITGLSDTSYIYANSDLASNYIFVKNILVPFNNEQTQLLSNAATTLGGTDSDEYIAYREKLAAEIVADDYTSEKTDDKYATVSDLFTHDGTNLAINTANTAWDGILKANGEVDGADVAAKSANIVKLMEKFNTDAGQHAKVYEYVVRVDNDDDYTQPWVTEFVDAAKEAWGKGVGSYAICVSSYGVHIVYYSANVTAQFPQSESDLTALFNGIVGGTNIDTTSPAYRVYKAYFEKQSNTIVSDDLKALKKTYSENNKATATSEFAKFISDNGLNYTFEDMIAVEEDED